MPKNIENTILDFISKLLALEHLDEILYKVVNEAPRIINCEGCSIYLVPELFKEDQQDLIDRNNNRLEHHAVGCPFIVLAAHSHSEESHYKIGQHFYRSGEGLTGWVFETELALFLDDLSDPKERQIYGGLEWLNKYKHASKWYSGKNDGRPKPFIALPLISNRRCVGVIRFINSTTGLAFSELAKDTVNSFGDLISRRIETELSKRDQQLSISNLISIGAMSNDQGVFRAIAVESQKTVGASVCRLYTIDEIGMSVKLKEDTDQFSFPKLKTVFNRGEGYIGWVFKTGLPLIVNRIVPQIKLDYFNIKTYTGSTMYLDAHAEIGQIKHIDLAEHELSCGNDKYTRFLGVPLSKGKGRIHGVLVALSHADSKEFNNDDLFLLNKMAQTVTLLLESIRQQELNEMLIHMGHEYGDKLFQYVVDQLPALVVAQGCSIFKKSDSDNTFKLNHTSSEYLKDKGRVKKISYTPGVGKTGFVAKYGRILVINYYGLGEEDSEGINNEQLETDFSKYKGPNFLDTNYVTKITDSRGKPKGLARIIRDKKDTRFTNEEIKAFEKFIDKNPYTSKEGLECHHEEKICEDGKDGGYSTSFLAVPFKDRHGNVYGVMRIPKSIPGAYFTEQDLNLVVSVSNRLLSYIELEQNLLTITGINTQINASFGVGSLDNILNAILTAVTDSLGFEFVNIQLVNLDKKTIRYRLGRSNPKITGAMNPDDWSKLVNFSLDSKKPDIHVWLLRKHKKPYVVKGWDKHFNRKIYENYNHKDLIRAYIPIIIPNTDDIIGTLEAGHHIKRRDYIDRDEIYMLRALADSAGIAIKNAQLHEELKTKIKQLKRAYKELATVSHELKTPLTPIKYFLNDVLEGFFGDLTPDQHQATIRAFRNLNEEMRLVHNILDFASIREDQINLKPIVVDLRDIINSVRPILEYWAEEKDIKIVEDLGHQPLKAEIDSERIRRVLINLTHNAVKHAPYCSKVIIRGSTHAGGVTISIVDGGPGIPFDKQEKIFKRFYRIAMDHEGMGIGLDIAKEIVEMHGGTIEVKSTPGEGSKFSFNLPHQIKE